MLENIVAVVLGVPLLFTGFLIIAISVATVIDSVYEKFYERDFNHLFD